MPEYLDELEALLGAPFFYDQPRENALHDDPSALAAEEELGARTALYVGGLRIFANDRAERRINSPTSEHQRLTSRYR